MPFFVSPKAKKFLEMPSAARAFGIKAVDLTVDAAHQATTTSRATYAENLTQRPHAPARASRFTTRGRLEEMIAWEAKGGLVSFDRNALDTEAWYWIILEVGSGESAVVHTLAGNEDIAIPSQIGRELPRGYYWGNADGSPAQYGGLHNLFPYAEGASYHGYASTANEYGEQLVIHREIHPKHFVRDGGIAGLDFLREGLTAEFRRLFTP